MTQYIVDAFTDKVFSGNPAAVCVLENPLDEETMKKIAAENNLSETAFIIKENESYRLRWFTPTKEVELCGHATLASAFVLLNFYEKTSNIINFDTISGRLTVTRKNDLYEIDLPTYELKEVPVTPEMEKAVGVKPQKAVLGLDLIFVLPTETDVKTAAPNAEIIKTLEGRMLHITAKGENHDCVSRSFGPKIGIIEDPVCGSAHCQLADYWSKELSRSKITAFQASRRGGTLYCELSENRRVKISGKAALFSVGELKL